MLEKPVLLVWGDFSDERIDLAALCTEFRWIVQHLGDYSGLAGVWSPMRVAATLLDASCHPSAWRDHLSLVRRALPGVPVLLAHRFNADLDGFDPDQNGVFDILLRPLHFAECRQTMGHLEQFLIRRRLARIARAGREVPSPIHRLQSVA
jgi:hypothetical protein